MFLKFDVPGTSFSELQLQLDGHAAQVQFNPKAINALLAHNYLTMQEPGLPQEGLQEVVLAWYFHHIRSGGQCSDQARAAVGAIACEEAPARLEPILEQAMLPKPAALPRLQMNFASASRGFQDLNLRRDKATRVVVFDVDPLQELVERNGLSMEDISEMPQEGLRDLVLAWYAECIGRGGHCSPEITLAVRELLSPNPKYQLLLRPAHLIAEPSELEPKREKVPAAARLGWLAGLGARVKSALGAEPENVAGVHFEYADYMVPSGPSMHVRPQHGQRRSA